MRFTLLSRFRAWWKSLSAVGLADWQLVLYTRPGCHLCEAAWQSLRSAQRAYHFQLAVVEVDSDPQLRALYGDLVPVVTVNGRVRFRGGVNQVLLSRLLEAEAARRRLGRWRG